MTKYVIEIWQTSAHNHHAWSLSKKENESRVHIKSDISSSAESAEKEARELIDELEAMKEWFKNAKIIEVEA